MSIRESVHDVKLTLLIALGLVIAVIFVFLRSFTATIIPSLTLPVSLIATFAVMYLLNYSLDNLSLMALTLCIGFVVDDTIVMLENIGRHMEMGKPAMRAAFDGAKEVEFTIIAMTVSLVAVFIPVLFMGGIVGRLLQEFAVTIGVAILVSCFVSISLTPMLCSRFLKTSHGKKHGRLYNLTERMFDGSLRAYDVSLQFAPQASGRHDGAVAAVRRGAAYLFVIVPKGFLPIGGSGTLQRQRRSDPGHRLRRNGPPPAGSRGDSRAGSRHRRFQQQRWRRRRRKRRCQLVESGPHQRRLEAAGRTYAVGRSDHGRACGRSSRRCRAYASSWSISRPSILAAWAEPAPSTSSRCRIPIPPSSIARRLRSKR